MKLYPLTQNHNPYEIKQLDFIGKSACFHDFSCPIVNLDLGLIHLRHWLK